MEIDSIVPKSPIRSIRIILPLKSEDENRKFELCKKGETNTLLPKDSFVLYRWIENMKTMINPVYAESQINVCG